MAGTIRTALEKFEPECSMCLRTSLFRALVVASLWISVCAPHAEAQGLVILDCQGITRAVHETKGAQFNRVEIEVADPNGASTLGRQVQIVNNLTGESLTATIENGKVVFERVPPGNYSIVVAGTSLKVGAITIGASQLGLLLSGGVIAGGALVGGGAVAGAVTVVENQSGGSKDTPTPTPSPTPTPQSTSKPDSSPKPQPTPTPTPTCDCDPDAEPTPLAPFRDPEAAILSPYR